MLPERVLAAAGAGLGVQPGDRLDRLDGLLHLGHDGGGDLRRLGLVAVTMAVTMAVTTMVATTVVAMVVVAMVVV